ncbi:MAG: DUF4093 domain-containing protein [Clostridiales bacterium]|nr:DUF4093 domain-containing protein [Clostridiales bacterium]
MIKIRQAVIVEGKYDKIKLSKLLDTIIIPTDGFSIFKDREKQRLIKKLADTRGIIIMTDSDSAGFKIRSFIGGSVGKEKITHVYIPDIFGKEKRKTEPSKEGKLGVEGVPTGIILSALRKAGIIYEETREEKPDPITNIDFYEDGFSGKADSAERRKALLRYFGLPERLSTHSAVEVINSFADREDYKRAVAFIDEAMKRDDEK